MDEDERVRLLHRPGLAHHADDLGFLAGSDLHPGHNGPVSAARVLNPRAAVFDRDCRVLSGNGVVQEQNVGVLAGTAEYIKDLCLQIFLMSLNRPIPIFDQASYYALIHTQPWYNSTFFLSDIYAWA